MRRKLIIDGNAVYEIDDECVCRKEARRQQAIEPLGTARQTITNASGEKEDPRGNRCHGAGREAKSGQDIHYCGRDE